MSDNGGVPAPQPTEERAGMAISTPIPTQQGGAVGRVIAITGPVVDVEFPAGSLPAIFNAIRLETAGEPVVCEVQQHLGNNWVRTVAMSTTDGLARGTEAIDLGAPISVPVGPQTLGRVFNVLGEPIDGKGPVEQRRALSHPSRRAVLRRAGHGDRGLRDRHQGHRPHLPLRQGRQDRRLRRRRRGQDRHHPGAHPQRRPGARRLLRLRRRGRALARGQRPHRRDGRVRGHGEDRHGLRPDERAARCPPARGPDRPDDGRVLPRRGP